MPEEEPTEKWAETLGSAIMYPLLGLIAIAFWGGVLWAVVSALRWLWTHPLF